MAKFTFNLLSIFGKKESPVAEQYLQEALLPLSVLDEELPKTVLEYVLCFNKNGHFDKGIYSL
ncbi:hypothetical protein AB7W40_16080 [Providencia rettgeri]